MASDQNIGSAKTDYFMILTVSLLFIVFLIWANYTHLDLVTRGGGRVIAARQNKNVQSPDRGTIKSYLVEEGSGVTEGQIIAIINPIEASILTILMAVSPGFANSSLKSFAQYPFSM